LLRRNGATDDAQQKSGTAPHHLTESGRNA
jgi:hypothetical protein